MRALEALWTALPDTAEWNEFHARAPALERELGRSLERLLVQDPRCPADPPSQPSVTALTASAFHEVLEEWEDKPAGVRPSLWLLKQAIMALDTTLDLLIAAGDLAPVDGMLRPTSVVAGRDERARWHQVAACANPALAARALDEFSTGESREILRDVERALGRLPELRRRAVTHRFLDGLPIEDVSFLLDISQEEAEIELGAGLKLIQLELQPA